MSAVPQFQGIDGLEPRMPIGAVLTVGRKGPKGNPIENDRFFIVSPQEVDGVRPPHPSFDIFNNAAVERRTTLRANLVHSARDQCFQHELKAQVLPGYPPHPAKAPTCMGDGHQAERWINGEYQKIPCPNSLCPFRQADGNKPIPCKPFGRLLLRPRWADGSTLPAPLMKFTTGSWNTTANILGLFTYVEEQAQQLGVDGFSLYGLPITLTLTKKKRTGDAGGRAFPVVQVTPDGDLLEFLFAQRERIRQLGAPPVIAALTDREQNEPAVIVADSRSHNTGPAPINVDVPQESDG